MALFRQGPHVKANACRLPIVHMCLTTQIIQFIQLNCFIACTLSSLVGLLSITYVPLLLTSNVLSIPNLETVYSTMLIIHVITIIKKSRFNES